MAKRQEIQKEIQEAKELQEWRDKKDALIENIAGPIHKIKEDLEKIKKHTEARIHRKQLENRTQNTILQTYAKKKKPHKKTPTKY